MSIPDFLTPQSRVLAQPKRSRVAFVTQRCGDEVNGGAEFLCRTVADRLSRHLNVEILTTCALDYTTWENHYPPGDTRSGNVLVRRFPVDSTRDTTQFNLLSAHLLAKSPDVHIKEQEDWMRAQGPRSARLLEHIQNHAQNYDAFIFFGYLYAQSYFGLPLVHRKSVLVPCAHDEWPIHFPMWEHFFKLPQLFIFNTPEELEFARHRFPNLRIEGATAGIGVCTQRAPSDPWRFRTRFGISAPFLLYVGRIDPSKGCDNMFAWYLRARRAGLIPHKLVLIGRAAMQVPHHRDIISLGYLSEFDKNDAFSAADWLLMPSQFESLSIVLLESWQAGRPALVNGSCPVLVGHCKRSQGGLWVDSFESWAAALTSVTPRERDALGANGRKYVAEHYTWERIEEAYLNALDAIATQR